MRKFLILLLFTAAFASAQTPAPANNAYGTRTPSIYPPVGVSKVDVLGGLQLNSTNSPLVPPRPTTTQKNAITSPPAGSIVFDTTLNLPNWYNGSNWVGFFTNQTIDQTLGFGNVTNKTLKFTCSSSDETTGTARFYDHDGIKEGVTINSHDDTGRVKVNMTDGSNMYTLLYGFSLDFFKDNKITRLYAVPATAHRNIGLPNADGYLGVSINGNYFNSSGALTLTGLNQTFAQTLTNGHHTGGIDITSPDGTTNIFRLTNTETSWTSLNDIFFHTDKLILSNDMEVGGDIVASAFVGTHVGEVTVPSASASVLAKFDASKQLTGAVPETDYTSPSGAGTLSNKSMSGSANTFSNIPTSALTGVVPSANGGAGSVNGLLKANGSGTTSQAAAGTDYVAPTSWVDYSSSVSITGWSSFTTKKVRYLVEGKKCTYQFWVSGPSNTTSVSISTHVAAGTNAVYTNSAIYREDNSAGSASPARADINATDTSIRCTRDFNSSGGWTASGTKTVTGSITFEIN